MEDLPFLNADPAHRDFQYLEDLATASWFSEVFFAAVELGLFGLIESHYPDTKTLARLSETDEDGLERLLLVLLRQKLIIRDTERWMNSQVVRKYLLPDSSSYMGDFLLYRKYMQANWKTIVKKVSLKKNPLEYLPEPADYQTRTFNYVRAMDQLVIQKAEEILDVVGMDTWKPPVLDMGGGAGSLSRLFLEKKIGSIGGQKKYGDVFDLAEVIAAVGKLYPDPDFWVHLDAVSGDFRQDRSRVEKKYGLILISNFLHAYDSEEAKLLLLKACRHLEKDGLILIHDYFPDRRGRSPVKGPLYDLNMMLNTYNGRCHKSSQIETWLEQGGIIGTIVRDLVTDSSIILGFGEENTSFSTFRRNDHNHLKKWEHHAVSLGFEHAVLLPASEIVTADWVREKCKSGCRYYGKNLKCPPNGLTAENTANLLASYDYGVVIEGTPPAKDFFLKLLALERKAFLAGFHKALSFGAGHCPFCDPCPGKGDCLMPDKSRPSMEGSGIDVFETAKNAGISLMPVTEKNGYVKYIGLLLLK